MLAEQAAKPLTESPAMTLEEIGKKIYDLEREVKYLLTKLKIYKPKPKPKPENETTKLNATKISKWHDICCFFFFFSFNTSTMTTGIFYGIMILMILK